MRSLAGLTTLIAITGLCALAADNSESPIRKVLTGQVEAWNRGDIPDFVTSYAPDCIFVGKEIARGRAQLLARYREAYPTRAAMGHLTFSGLAIHFLSKDVALVTGQWHIDRQDPAGNKGIGGLFSLVFQRHAQGWEIALDHTS